MDEMNEWLPVSSAPRDGTRILLARVPNNMGPPMVKRVVIGHWTGRYWKIELTSNHYPSQDVGILGWQFLPLHPERHHGDGK